MNQQQKAFSPLEGNPTRLTPTEWHVWNEGEGELSARERLIAILAFKIGSHHSLTEGESLAQLSLLPDEDIFAVLKMVALFDYWQQLARA